MPGVVRMGIRIKRLPISVVSSLRSGTAISSVAQIVEELLCNSLDANASKIEIAVDGEAHHIKLVDDGSGISRDDLTLAGERHATSKLHSLDELEEGISTLGFRGEALSSLCDLALVEITSRCRGSPNTYCKLLKGSTTVSIGLSGEQRGYGTTVSVREIFYNQPVRRKLLSTSQKKTLQSVKECVLRFALIYPHVSFTVKDPARREILLQTKGRATMDRVLLDVFGEDVFCRLQRIDYAHEHLRLTGFISRTYHSHSSKALQFFYVNRRFVLKTAFHKLLNSWMGPPTHSAGQANRELPKGKKVESAAGKQLSPIFVLNVSCPSSEYDITFEPSKTLVEFKDWASVIFFARRVLQKTWGDPSTTKILNLERAFNVPPPETSINDSDLQQNTVKVNPGEKHSFPPMPVRRTLVQGDHCQPLEFLEQDLPPAARREPGKVVKTPSFWSRPRSPFVQQSNELPASFEMTSDLELVQNDEDRCQPDDTTVHDNTRAMQTNWHLSPCGVKELSDKTLVPFLEEDNENFTDVLGSDWFLKDVSPDSTQSNLSFSDGAPLSLQCSAMADIFPESNECLRNSFARKEFSSPNVSSGSMMLGVGKEFRSKALDASLTFPDISLGSGNEYEKARQWLEEEVDSTQIDPLNNNNLVISPLVAGKSKVSLEVNRKAPMMLPSARRELHFEDREFFESADDDFGIEMTSMIVPPNKMKKARFMAPSDLDDLDEFFPSKFHSFSQKERTLDFTESSRSQFRETLCRKEFSVEGGAGLDTQNDYDCMEIESWTPQSRRSRVPTGDRSSRTHKAGPNGMEWESLSKEHADLHFRHPLPQEENDARAHSGPPFYRPPSRSGAHVNPCNSLSTKSRSENVPEHSKLSHTKADVGRNKERAANNWKSSEGKDPTRALQNPELSSAGIASICGQRRCEQNEVILSVQPLSQRIIVGEEAERPLEVRDPAQLTLNVDLDRASKYRSTNEAGSGIEGAELPMDVVKAMLKEWSNPCMRKNDDILDLSSGILASKNSFLLPGAITKDVLKRARVLRQVDAKFIASVSRGILLIIDQHAADERVRLEELRETVLDRSMAKKVSLLSNTQELTITFTEQQALHTFHEQIWNWGWRYKVITDRRAESETEGMCKVLLSSVPLILGVGLTGADLTEYLQQLADTQGSSAPPPAIIRLLNYKACRGAIMFGDNLLPAECSQLIERLKGTNLCFQCAHGRPTMVPLLDLEGCRRWFDNTSALHKNGSAVSKPRGELRGTASMMEAPPGRRWHGLQLDARPNVQRAIGRLESALGM